MSNDIYLIGEVGGEINLNSVIKAVNESDKTLPLNVHIHSPGGSVYDGLAIYNYLKGLDQEVNTASSGLVASIASIIFLAGNKETRKINSTDNFLIHLPMAGAIGNAQDLEKTSAELRNIENKLSDIYAKETDLTKDESLELMKKDEMLDVNFLKEKGFISGIIEFKAVATINNKNKMSTETVTKKEVEGLFTKFKNELKDFFKMNEPTNKMVKDANGVDIDFFDLENDAEIIVGSEATIGGDKASGEYTMTDGNKWTFADGVLTDITEEATDLETVQAENDELKDQLQTAGENLQAKADELDAKDVAIENMKTEFTNFKNEVTSKFDFDGKKNKKENLKDGFNSEGIQRTPIKL